MGFDSVMGVMKDWARLKIRFRHSKGLLHMPKLVIVGNYLLI